MKKLWFVASILLTFFRPYVASCQTSPSNPGSTSAQSEEQRVDSLEKKVDGLDKNVTEILRLLKAQPPTGQTNPTPDGSRNPTPTTATSSATPKLTPGAKLEVWPLPPNFQGSTPPGMSMGAMVDSGDLFDFDNFLSEDAFKPLKLSLVGLRWSGFINIKEKGNHNFILERDGLPGYNWPTSLKIDGQAIISRNNGVGPGGSDVAAQSLNLDPGYYRFELFTYFGAPSLYPRLQIRVKFRSENSLVPTTLDAKSVFHEP
jgi:hypothetical protein